MGIHIFLEIVPQRIDATAWGQVYDETLRLLQDHPAHLMGLDHRMVGDQEVIMYTRSIERDRDDPQERCWCVVGDRETLHCAEDHVMYRDLARYIPRNPQDLKEDILLDSTELTLDETDGMSGGWNPLVRVLENKTQDKPYHIPLLAAAMVVEDRFPRHAMVSGDINLDQAQKAREWAETVLHRSIQLPIRLDPKRLFERLAKHLSGQDLMQALALMYIDDHHRVYQEVFRTFPRVQVEQLFVDRLAVLKKSGYHGAGELFLAWLNATKDLPRLCELCCVEENGPRLSPEKFVDDLAHMGIIKPSGGADFLEDLSKSPKLPPAIASIFAMIAPHVARIVGQSLEVQFEEGQVEASLVQVFGHDGTRLLARIREKELSAQKIAAQFCDLVETQQTKILEEVKSIDVDSCFDFAVMPSFDQLSKEEEEYLSLFAYGLSHLQEQFRKEQSKKSPFVFDDAVSLKEYLVLSLIKRGPRLTEDAWDWIQKEEDLNILQFLALLISIRENELGFSNMRRATLENQKLCEYLVKISNDRILMAAAGAKAEEIRKNAR